MRFILLATASLLSTHWMSAVHAEQGVINLCVKKRQGGVTGTNTLVEITCYDEDNLNFDDRMAGPQNSSITDGCATLNYEIQSWDFFSDPGIYCELEKEGFRTHYTDTKVDHPQETPANFGDVIMYPDRRDDGGPEGRDCEELPITWPDAVLAASVGPPGEFDGECQNLDKCYSQCQTETKQDCHDEFRALAFSRCNNVYDLEGLQDDCKASAELMYGALEQQQGSVPMDCTHLSDECGVGVCGSNGVCDRDIFDNAPDGCVEEAFCPLFLLSFLCKG